MKALDILKKLHLEDRKREYPNFPEQYIPVYKYSDNTANGLQRCIKDFLNLSGHQAERINTMGVYVAGKVKQHGHLAAEITQGKYRKGTSTKGSADISSTIKVNIEGYGFVGLSVKWEVKVGKDRLSSDQILYGEKITEAGGKYYVVRDFEEFYKYYLEVMNGKQEKGYDKQKD